MVAEGELILIRSANIGYVYVYMREQRVHFWKIQGKPCASHSSKFARNSFKVIWVEALYLCDSYCVPTNVRKIKYEGDGL